MRREFLVGAAATALISLQNAADILNINPFETKEGRAMGIEPTSEAWEA